MPLHWHISSLTTYIYLDFPLLIFFASLFVSPCCGCLLCSNIWYPWLRARRDICKSAWENFHIPRIHVNVRKFFKNMLCSFFPFAFLSFRWFLILLLLTQTNSQFFIFPFHFPKLCIKVLFPNPFQFFYGEIWKSFLSTHL